MEEHDLVLKLNIGFNNCKEKSGYCSLRKTCPCGDYKMDKDAIEAEIKIGLVEYLKTLKK